MTRKYKTWGGISVASLVGLVAIYSLLSILLKSFFLSPDTFSLMVILVILFVAAIAYINYTSLQLRKRTKEFYVRKLLGAEDNQLMMQLMLESVVLTSFLVVSGMVLAELATPWCDRILGASLPIYSVSFIEQILLVIIIVIPIGVLSITFPARNFIAFIRNNFSRLSKHLS